MTPSPEDTAMNVSGAVLRLWKAVPREVRLSFERHPVDDVRTLEAERDQLREENERLTSGRWTDEERKRFLFEATKASYAEGTRAGCEELSIAAAEMSVELDRYRTTLVEIANGVHGMASVLAARALDPTEAPRKELIHGNPKT